MKISEEKFNYIFNFFLIFLPCAFVFGKLGNFVIILFTFYNLLFYKPILFNKEKKKYAFYVLIPFLLEFAFFWNNDSIKFGVKSIEKYIALLSFVLFIIGHSERIRFEFILKRYCVIFITIIFILFLRFVIFYPNYINKYLNGIHLWEMGYVFTQSFKVHAPALNLQLVFASVCCLFLLIKAIKSKILKEITIYGFAFWLSFFLILFINTRLALALALLCYLIIVLNGFYKVVSNKIILLIQIFFIVLISIGIKYFVSKDQYMIHKYTEGAFAHLDKVGKLDEIEHPEINVYGALVTRLSIWKSSYNLGVENIFFGVGSSNINYELVNYYNRTNQHFLAKYKLITHNQFLNYFVKFGIIGLLCCFLYFNNIFAIARKSENILVFCFFLIFLFSNFTDDFLNRFDGIAFSGFFISLFFSVANKKN
jgi:hypothetical protein